jgi:hypothetical protein
MPSPFSQALTSGGGKSEAFASALASAVGSGGCNSVSNVLAQAQASAESSGKGQVSLTSGGPTRLHGPACVRWHVG